MGKLQIRLGRSGVGKTTKMLQEIGEDTSGVRHIILVPDFVSHQVERELCTVCGNKITLRAEVLTFSRLSHQVFFHTGGLHEGELDDVGQMVLLQRAVAEAKGQLSVLEKYTQHSSFYEKLLKTLGELKGNQVDLQRLFDLDDSVVHRQKYQEIALICSLYDSYNQGLGEKQLEMVKKALEVDELPLVGAGVTYDRRDRISRMAEKLKHSDWGQGYVFWLDGFSDFSVAQMAVVEQLMRLGDSVTVNLLGEIPEEVDVTVEDFSYHLFAHSLKTMQELMDRGAKLGLPVTYEELKADFSLRSAGLSTVEAELFSPKKAEVSGNVTDIHLFSACTLRSEVEWVASEILHLVQEQGHRFRDIVVVARDFSRYRGLIEGIFPRYEIPVFTTEMVSILEKPVISVVNRLFSAVQSGYRYEEMFRYLKSGFSSLSMEEVDLLEEYVLFWKIRGKAWGNEFLRHPKGYDKAFTPEDRAFLNALNEMREKAIRPLLALEEGEVATASVHCKRLYGFFVDVGIYDKILARQDQLTEQGDLLQAEEYSQLWDKLCHCFEICHELSGTRQMDFMEFTKIFLLALTQTKVGTIPVCLEQVGVGETTRLKHRRGKTVFWLGATEDCVPKATESGGLFSDHDRYDLARQEIFLNEDGMALFQREMTTAYEICALPSEHLYLSWTSRGKAGKPCFLVEDLLALFPDLSVISEEMLEGTFRLMSPESALEHTEKFPFVKNLLEERFGDLVADLEQVKGWRRGTLNEISRQILYGEEMSLSATRLNTLMACQFSDFMKYGLGLLTRRESSFSATDAGNFIHAVLKKRLDLEKDGEDLVQIQEKVSDLIEMLFHDSLIFRSARDMYYMERLKKEVAFVLEDCMAEQKVSQFIYAHGELGFHCDSKDIGCGSGYPMKYRGSIDRVDVACVENEGEKSYYYRIVDYKSGKNVSVSLADVYYGRNLQLPLYHLVCGAMGENLFRSVYSKEEISGAEIACAGMNLFPSKDLVMVTDKLLEKSSKMEGKRREQLVRQGIYVEDLDVLLQMEQIEYEIGDKFSFLPLKIDAAGHLSGSGLVEREVFGKLMERVQGLLSGLPEAFASGEVAANPYLKSRFGDSGCKFCDYQSACFFEDGRYGECYRRQFLVKDREIVEALEQGE